MELLQTFAPDVWLLYNRELEAFKFRLDKELEGLRKEAELVRVLSACLFLCLCHKQISHVFHLSYSSSTSAPTITTTHRSTSAARPSKKSWPHAWPT